MHNLLGDKTYTFHFPYMNTYISVMLSQPHYKDQFCADIYYELLYIHNIKE
jgi:hypothetical protein